MARPVDRTRSEHCREDLLLKAKGPSVALGPVQPDFAYVRCLRDERTQKVDFSMPLRHDLWMQSKRDSHARRIAHE